MEIGKSFIESIADPQRDPADPVALVDLLKKVLKKAWIIALVALLGALAGGIHAVRQPPEYIATAKFIPLSSSPGGSMAAAQLTSLVGISLPQFGQQGGVNFEALLTSDSFAERMITKHDLYPMMFGEDFELGKLLEPPRAGMVERLLGLFKSDEPRTRRILPDERPEATKLLNRAAPSLRGALRLVVTKERVYTLSFSWDEPETAAVMANAYLEELEHFLLENNVTKARKTRVFIEKRLELTEVKLKDIEERLRGFSEETGIFEVNQQIESLLTSINKLKQQIVDQEVVQEELRWKSTGQNPALERSGILLKALHGKVAELESGDPAGTEAASAKSDIPLSDMPGHAISSMRLQRELAVLQKIYSLLREELETARINEASETESIQIIDYAVPPKFPVRPKVTLTAVASGIMAAAAAVFAVLFFELAGTGRRRAKED